MNVKIFVEQQGSLIFPNRLIGAIKLEVQKQAIVKSSPGFFGTAFHIAFDYELFRRGFILDYEPRMDPVGIFSKDEMAVIRKTEMKKELNASDICILTHHEMLSRFIANPSMYFQISSDPVNLDKISKMEVDLSTIREGIDRFFAAIPKCAIFIQNPLFRVEGVDVYGDGDFVMDDILFEIKCVSDDDINVKTIKQLMLYKLIHDLNSDNKQFEINRFGYLNPLKGQIHVWDAIIPDAVQFQWKAYISQFR
jgi:hypothetical protein